MTFVGENDSYDISIPKVKTSPVAADINDFGAYLTTNDFFDDDTANYVNAYYTIDSIVASAA